MQTNIHMNIIHAKLTQRLTCTYNNHIHNCNSYTAARQPSPEQTNRLTIAHTCKHAQHRIPIHNPWLWPAPHKQLRRATSNRSRQQLRDRMLGMLTGLLATSTLRKLQQCYAYPTHAQIVTRMKSYAWISSSQTLLDAWCR